MATIDKRPNGRWRARYREHPGGPQRARHFDRKVVQARLGHASASETLDTYSHLWPDNEERTRTAVDEILGPRPAHEEPADHA